MINEDRVKECFHMAVFDQNDEKQCRQMTEFYKSDYVAKELIKSFFSGTIAFVLLFAVYLMQSFEQVLENINNIDWINMGKDVAVLYAIFLLIYFMITAVVYRLRFRIGRRKLKKYYGHLKRVIRMYDREERM